MSEPNYVILCSAVLPNSLKTISQTSIDLYEDEYHSLKDTEQEIKKKQHKYKEILEKLDLTESEVSMENLTINVTVVSRDLRKHRQFSL